MTNRSRWLALTALVGLFVGIARSQMTVSTLCLSLLLWLFYEWIQFSVHVAREIARFQMVRSVNGRNDATGVLWAGRTVEICVRIECNHHNIYPQRVFRDVVPENIEVIDETISKAFAESKAAIIPRSLWIHWLTEGLVSMLILNKEVSTSNQTTVRSPKKVVEIKYLGRVRAAGDLIFPGIRVEFRDPLNLFRRDRFFVLQQSYRILPSYSATTDASPIVKRMNSIPRQGIHRQQRPGIGFELLELREYIEGDPPKSIAWKASARRDKLMTRQYESEVPVRVQLIIDGTVSNRIGGFGHRLLDQSTRVGASIAHSVTSAGDSIGCFLVDERGVERTTATAGTAGFYKQLRAMAVFSVNRSTETAGLSPRMIETAYAICSERYPELLDPQINPLALGTFGLLNPRSNPKRVQLAAILAELYDLPTVTQIEMVQNSTAMAKYLLRFLCESGMPWMEPVVSLPELAPYIFPSQVRLLTQAITSAVAHAHDNEVFVFVADLLGEKNSLVELLHAIQVAKGKHHRVAVICPSPTFRRPISKSIAIQENSATELRRSAESIRLLELSVPLKRSLAKLGVTFSIAGEAKAIRIVLSEIAIAKSGRIATQGSKR